MTNLITGLFLFYRSCQGCSKNLYDQLYQYLDKHKYLVSHNSGYRALHLVVTCLLRGTSNWHIDIDNGRYTAMIFIDLKKVFGTVDHQILLDKAILWNYLDMQTNRSVLILVIGSNTVEQLAQLLASVIFISVCHRDRV